MLNCKGKLKKRQWASGCLTCVHLTHVQHKKPMSQHQTSSSIALSFETGCQPTWSSPTHSSRVSALPHWGYRCWHGQRYEGTEPLMLPCSICFTFVRAHELHPISGYGWLLHMVQMRKIKALKTQTKKCQSGSDLKGLSYKNAALLVYS